MNKDSKILAIGFGTMAAVVLFGAGIFGAYKLNNDSQNYSVSNPNSYGLNITTYTGTYDADTQYLGRCAVVTPPTPDPCDSTRGTLEFTFWAKVVNASQFKSWRKQNPGEYARLNAHMANPVCPSGGVGPTQDMLTYYGGYLYDVVIAYACVAGAGGGTIAPLVWPQANAALDPNRTDKTPPTAPGPITVTPNP